MTKVNHAPSTHGLFQQAVNLVARSPEIETLDDLVARFATLKVRQSFAIALAYAQSIVGSKEADAGLAKAFAGLDSAVSSFQNATQQVIRAVIRVNKLADTDNGLLFNPIEISDKYPNLTMPNFNSFTNCTHYWFDLFATNKPDSVESLVNDIQNMLNGLPFRSAFIQALDNLHTHFAFSGDAELVDLVKSAKSYAGSRERLLDAVCRFNAYLESSDMLRIESLLVI